MRKVYLQQHQELPSYGAAQLFKSEINYYAQVIAESASSLVWLKEFCSLREIQAATIAARLKASSICVDRESLNCGHIDSDTIAAFVQEKSSLHALFSAKRKVDYGSDEVKVIGELLNPGFRKEVKELMQRRDVLALKDLISEQQGNGADILSLSCEAKGLDAEATLEWLLPHYAAIDLPVYLEAEDIAWLELALPALPGCPMVRCRSSDEATRRDILELCGFYRANVAISEAEIPDRNERARVKNIEALLDEARRAGISDNKIVIEVRTIASPLAPLILEENLRVISTTKERFNLPLLVPVSQVSRSRLLHGWSNAFFAACAIDRGANLILANPSQREVMAIVHAANEMRR